MVIYTDGRLEGTPEELAAYMKAMKPNYPLGHWVQTGGITVSTPTIAKQEQDMLNAYVSKGVPTSKFEGEC